MVSQEIQSIYIRCGQAEMERAALPEDIQKQDFYVQEIEIKLTEAQQKGKVCSRTDSCTILC